jgi:hypothetical protein
LEEIRSSHSKNMEKVDEPNNKHWVQKYILDRAKISSAYTYGSVRSFVDGEEEFDEMVLNIILRLK